MKAKVAAETVVDIMTSYPSAWRQHLGSGGVASDVAIWCLSLMAQTASALLSKDKETALQTAKELVFMSSAWGVSGKEDDVLLLVQAVEDDDDKEEEKVA